jgi:hypothetical protein
MGWAKLLTDIVTDSLNPLSTIAERGHHHD